MVVLVVLFGAGSNSLLGSVSALAGWAVLPLFWAVGRAPEWLPAIAAGQVMLAAGLVWGMRALLWPVAWRAAERALPIPTRLKRRSDALVVALGLLPLGAVYFAGALAWWQQHPPWLQSVWPWALMALVAVCGASLAAGMGVLQALRRPAAAAVGGRPLASVQPGSTKRTFRLQAPWRALVLLPLVRGTGRRTARALGLGLAALLVLAVLLWRLPALAGWWLAGWAAMALLVSSRLRTLIHLELAPLAEAARVLPVAPRRWRVWLAMLALGPLVLSLPALLWALPWGPARPVMVGVYLLACIAVCGAEVAARQSGPPADKAARWLVSLVLLLALASEVVA